MRSISRRVVDVCQRSSVHEGESVGEHEVSQRSVRMQVRLLSCRVCVVRWTIGEHVRSHGLSTPGFPAISLGVWRCLQAARRYISIWHVIVGRWICCENLGLLRLSIFLPNRFSNDAGKRWISLNQSIRDTRRAIAF